jgi:hypothetical protein
METELQQDSPCSFRRNGKNHRETWKALQVTQDQYRPHDSAAGWHSLSRSPISTSTPLIRRRNFVCEKRIIQGGESLLVPRAAGSGNRPFDETAEYWSVCIPRFLPISRQEGEGGSRIGFSIQDVSVNWVRSFGS